MAAKKKPARRRPKKAKAAKKTARRRPKKAKAAKKTARRRPKKAKAAKKAASRRSRPKKAAKKASRRRSPKKMKAARRRPKKSAKKMSRRSSKSARAMGMTKGARKNPAGILDFLKTEAQDMMAIAPSVAAQLGSMAAIGFASSKASEQIRKRVAAEGAMHKDAGAISSGAITIAAFAAMKMVKSDKVKQFTLPVLFGGMAATLVQVLAAVKVKKDAGEQSLGQKLGLPIGDYMALSGFVDVHGKPVAVDGFGDYVPQALGRIELSKGPYSEGTVVSMGDYVPQALGELSLHEGRFHEGTVIGEIGQMSEGRQGARALNSPGDPTFESFVDSGSLSGSVFE
jgi:hypothetical protein